MNWIIISGVLFFAAFWAFAMFKGKTFIHWPLWARMSSMGALAAMMFGLIWYMNSEREKAEVVWATGKTEVTWKKSRIPLRVSYMDDDITASVVKEAVKMWNRVGCKLFVIVEPGEAWDVMIERGIYRENLPTDNDPLTGRGSLLAGSTWKDPEHQRFTLRIHEPGNLTHEYLIVAHELSHVLGLAHDNDKRFITTSGAQKYDDLSKFLPHPSHKDSVALKKRYCN